MSLLRYLTILEINFLRCAFPIFISGKLPINKCSSFIWFNNKLQLQLNFSGPKYKTTNIDLICFIWHQLLFCRLITAPVKQNWAYLKFLWNPNKPQTIVKVKIVK